MTVQYASLSWPQAIGYKELQYTQTGGTSPDKASLKLVPQAAAVAATGTLSMTYNGVTLTLPDSLVDKSNIQYTANGWVSSVVIFDRRWKWAKASNMAVHWNDRDANGQIITPSKRTLRQMVTEILNWIGESKINVAAVSNTLYPEVNEISAHPLSILNQLLDEFGYEITLGFGADAVTVCRKNVGAYLPTAGVRMTSTSFDPPTPPYAIRTMFGPSRLQARLKMVAIALDTDGEWKSLNELSYKPAAGWETIAPGGFVEVGVEHSQEAMRLARNTVYRYYRIDTFADGTLTVPVDSGAIMHITQVLPLIKGLFPKKTSDGSSARPDEVLYGEVAKVIHDPAPAGTGNTEKGDRLDLEFVLSHEQGVMVFDEHVYKIVDGEIHPANLWLECVMQVRHNTHWQYAIYHKDTVLEASGFGYHTVSLPEISYQSEISYDANHSITGSANTGDTLDALAATAAAVHSSTYTAESSQSSWYSYPQFQLRVDGAINQVTHIISDTQGHYSVASRNMSHDVYVKDASDKRAQDLDRYSRQSGRRFKIAQQRRERGSA